MKKLLKRILKIIKRLFQQFLDNEQPSLPLQDRLLETPTPICSIPTFVPQWQNGLILVCSQCTVEQFSGSYHKVSSGTTASEELQKWLKSRLKLDGLWGKYRVVSTSCLGVCPKESVAVVFYHDEVGQQCFIISEHREREILYSYIKHINQ
ncbi:(2Fe-2S) ferredoxin domain-containing protein [Nostoc sp. LEGE 06077]|uniref:(2Fe-2S) ferredoxin domain-containing protein n=1 Tax=Nostoc sp. LEGE 06077 TaxID=915325 RepID=UPI00187EAB8A|nr:(2Fe-2S) ferredoxin domain-containing protein [Nostoc sp. LEGE 06077]MBE9210344.1 (2Fe-2S) ferredoxin domain-containing protein [Nostoc sp. LEGE 06077]